MKIEEEFEPHEGARDPATLDALAEADGIGEPPDEPPAWLVAAWEEQDRLGEAPCEDEPRQWELFDPERLAEVDPAQPSPEALAIDAAVTGAGTFLTALRFLDAAEARHAGQRVRLLAALTRSVGAASTDAVRRADAPSIAASELAAALRISQRSARGQVDQALALSSDGWAPVLDAMSEGRLPRRLMLKIVDAALPVPPERLRAFAASVVEYACPEDQDRIPSPGALGRALRRLVEAHAVDPLETRRKAAEDCRRVDLEPAPDGMCWLTAYLPLAIGAAIDTRLEALARSLHSPGEQRGIAQLRADVLADLLTGSTAGARLSSAGPANTGTGDRAAEGMEPMAARSGTTAEDMGGTVGISGSPAARVRTELIVTVPASTLAGLSNTPGEIVGYGPIDPDAVRVLAAEAATWSRMWVDPDSGAPVALGRRRYTPTLAVRRQLGARDKVCRFPGCDKPAAATEADHTVEWAAGGVTDPRNLALLCREHHRLKSLGYWKVRQIGSQRPRAEQPRPEPSTALSSPALSGPALSSPALSWPPGSAEPRPGPPPYPAGALEWTSPTGARHVTFPESDPPPPF